MSLGLLLHGIITPDVTMGKQKFDCWQYKMRYGLYIVPIITSFLGVLGMAIERFQAFALYRDRRRLTRRFSIAWFIASWTFALCFLFVLLAQIKEMPENENGEITTRNELDKYKRDFLLQINDTILLS